MGGTVTVTPLPSRMIDKRVLIPGDQKYYPHRGQRVTVHYTAAVVGGLKFDSSRENGDPFMFRVGNGDVIRGWDQVIQTMCVGERSEITLSPECAYGMKGFYDIVPPNSTIVFDLELLDIQ